MEDKDKQQDEVLLVSSTLQSVNAMPENPYGVTYEYNRKNYDSPKARRDFHDFEFNGEQTIVDADGIVLFRSHDAAQEQFGRELAPYHEAQADHIDPLSNIHGRNKQNAFISDQDIKEVGNRKSNFQELSRHENASKGDSSEFQRGLESGDAERIANGLKTQTETDILLMKKTVQHVGKTFVDGAKDALAVSAIPIIVRGTQYMVCVANGEMTLEDAAKEMGKLGVSIAASGGSVRVASYALGQVLKDSENEVVKRFAQANQIGTVIIAGSIVVSAAGRFLSGETDAEGFFEEISRDGVSLISGMLASEVVGAFTVSTAAPVLAAMIVSSVCTEIYDQAKRLEEEKRTNEEIRIIAKKAADSIQEQKVSLRRCLKEDHARWAQQMMDAFQNVATGLSANNVSATNQGLRKVMEVYNKNVMLFESEDEALDALMNMRKGKQIGII